MELTAPDIDPHIVDAGHHVGIAGETEPAHVEERRRSRILDLHVHVLQGDDIAEILRAAVVLPGHRLPPFHRPDILATETLPSDWRSRTMTLAIRQVGPCFAGEVDGIDMRKPL